MDVAVACSACGSLVLRNLQAQHHAFHQRQGHVEAVDFRGAYQLSAVATGGGAGPLRRL